MLLTNLSWEQVREYLARDNRLILPIGAVEEHGRQLGLGCDYLLAESIANETGARTNVAVAPPLAYGMSHALMKFPGTFSLRPTTLMLVLEDLLRSAYGQGFRRVSSSTDTAATPPRSIPPCPSSPTNWRACGSNR